jgi:hypothetical protein
MESRMNTITALLLSFAAPGADGRPNDVCAADIAKARECVKQLANTKFKVRDTAEKQLIALGLASLDALKEGEKDADLHVQERCRNLQPTIRALTLQKRIDSFLANRDGPIPENLPFAAAFLKLTADSKEARKLYADVLVINPQMLDAIDQDKTKGVGLFQAYCQEIQQQTQYVQGIDYRERQKMITRAHVAMYFLLSSEMSADKSGRISSYGYTFLNAPTLNETLIRDDATTAPFRKLFLNWIEKEPQPYMVQRAVQIAAEARMKEALPLVLKLMNRKDLQGYTRAQTVLLLTKVGTKEHLKEVEPLLDDKSVIGNFGINNKMGQVQMRDVGLAVCIKLSGQKMSSYPFDVMQGADDNLYMSYIYCAFSSEEKREEAHKQYKDWKAKGSPLDPNEKLPQPKEVKK